MAEVQVKERTACRYSLLCREGDGMQGGVREVGKKLYMIKQKSDQQTKSRRK